MTIDVMFSIARYTETITPGDIVKMSEGDIEIPLIVMAIFLTKDGVYFSDLKEARKIVDVMSMKQFSMLSDKLNLAAEAYSAMIGGFDV